MKKGSWEEQTGYFVIEGIKVSGLKFSELPDAIRPLILNYILDVTVIQTNDDAKIVDQYRKVQQGKPLTIQQKREAFPSALNTRVHETEKHPLFDLISSARGKLGGGNRLILARLFVCEMQGVVASMNKSTISRLYLESGLEILPNREVERVFKEIIVNLDTCQTLFKHASVKINPSNVIPIYWAIRRIRSEMDILKFGKETRAWWAFFSKTEIEADKFLWSCTSLHPGYITAAYEKMYTSFMDYLTNPDAKQA